MSLLDCLPQAFCRMHYIEKKVLQIQVLAVKCDFLCVCYLNTVVLTSSCAGVNYVHQFCVGAAKGVLSPFVLQEIIMEALQRLNPAHVHNHLRTPAFHQLVQRCQQAYMQVKCALSSCLVRAARPLPALQVLPVSVCTEGKGPWALGAEVVHFLMHPSPSGGTGIGVTCLYGGCMRRNLRYCFCQGLLPPVLFHRGWSGFVSSSLQMLSVPF